MTEYLIDEKTLVRLADAVRDKISTSETAVAYVSNRENVVIDFLPKGLSNIGDYAFYQCTKLNFASIPKSINNIGIRAFFYCTALTNLTFKGTPSSIDSSAFASCNNLTAINVPWAEGEVANAPWGATNAVINYNYVEEG